MIAIGVLTFKIGKISVVQACIVCRVYFIKRLAKLVVSNVFGPFLRSVVRSIEHVISRDEVVPSIFIPVLA